MKFNILLVLATLAVQVMTAGKFRPFPAVSFSAGGPSQQVNMKNRADSNTNALAVNSALYGDSNAFANGASGNYNQVCQSAVAAPVCP